MSISSCATSLTHRRLFLQFWLLLCRLSNFPDASFKKTALFLTFPVSDKELKNRTISGCFPEIVPLFYNLSAIALMNPSLLTAFTFSSVVINARSLVMVPDSIVSRVAFSSLSAKSISS